jgi:hypothetical protein
VGIDLPDDADDPADKNPDPPADKQPDPPADKQPDPPADRVQPETRFRQEYYADLRAAAMQERTEPAGRSEPDARSKPTEQPDPAARPEPAARSSPGEPIENGHQPLSSSSWEQTAELSHWMWTEYKRRWPAEERPTVDRSDDSPGTWRGEGNRVLEPANNARIEAQCDRIADREREVITPALRAIESQDPDRHLVGLKDSLKGRDRIKEKVYDDMDLLGRSSRDAISLIPDTIRYTFQYDEIRYTQGVRADIARMEEQGFKLFKLRNYWSDDQYKGINSQWIEPDSGQRFEMQFHTRISFEAKQITHGAYERLRTHQADAFEELVLEAFQRKVTAAVPVPSEVTEIPDYREGEQHAR